MCYLVKCMIEFIKLSTKLRFIYLNYVRCISCLVAQSVKIEGKQLTLLTEVFLSVSESNCSAPIKWHAGENEISISILRTTNSHRIFS